MIWARRLYLPDEELKTHRYVSPLQASDHSDLPPTMIVTSEFDPLKDEGWEFAKRLEKVEIPTEYFCVQGVTHGIFDLVGALEPANRAMEKVVAEAKKYLG